jgi:uridylate kinase
MYKRILLKLSGEALASKEHIIDPEVLQKVVRIIKSVREQNIELAIVIGGGNIYRGRALTQHGLDTITGDHMGMMATVINALAIVDACNNSGITAKLFSAVPIGGGIADEFDFKKARAELENGKVLVFSSGTGSPCFTTDSAAALRAIEINADVIFKATTVDGVYSADPKTNPDATKYDALSFDEAINKNLAVMDTAAFSLCRQHNKQICVFSMFDDETTLQRILNGEKLGTIVKNLG